MATCAGPTLNSITTPDTAEVFTFDPPIAVRCVDTERIGPDGGGIVREELTWEFRYDGEEIARYVATRHDSTSRHLELSLLHAVKEAEEWFRENPHTPSPRRTLLLRAFGR